MARRSALSSFVLRGWFGLSRSQGITGLGISSFVIYLVYQHIQCVNTFGVSTHITPYEMFVYLIVGIGCLGYSICRRIFRFAKNTLYIVIVEELYIKM